jgi:primosomal protein N' (replication factor Y) (superfamily II helicase)
VAETRNDGALDLLPDMPSLDTAKGAEATKTPEATTGKSKPKRSKDPKTLKPAADKPVARIAVDLPLAHLDRPFDYLVPERLAALARPGVRVRVRFAGQLTDGYVLDRVDSSEHQGRLSYLERVVSAERVLTPEIAGLARAVADRYAGTLADVLRLAIPQRHAATETGKAAGAAEAAKATEAAKAAGSRAAAAGEVGPRDGLPPRPDPGPWARYPAGPAFLDAVAAGRPARAAWTALPGPTWPEEIARAAVTAASAGRGAVIVVPDARDLARIDEALGELCSPPGGPPAGMGGSPLASGAPAPDHPRSPSSPPAPGPPDEPAGTADYVTLTADLGPAERYRRWLMARRGQARIVAGTRAAMFAPVENLGLVVLWDDGDDLHAEPRAPYPNAREVLALRAHRAGAAALIGGFARTAELAQLVAAGWARDLTPDRATLRATAARVRPAADDRELGRDQAATTARLPSLALRTARAALEAGGPVLVQVPRRGYLAAIACGRCRAQARCVALVGEANCNGPLRLAGQHATPDCRWCGALATSWRCVNCGHDRLRAIVTGATRTAEELGRAFPGVKVRTSGGDLVLASVPDEPALVITTPGAEPLAGPGPGYAAALLLDGWALLGRPSLRAGEEALRRWLAAAALVRPDGTVLVHADSALAATQALIRWDPVTFAERELAERAELGFPPAVRMAAATGEATAVASLLAGTDPAFEVLGPVPVERGGAGETEDQVRALIRTSRARGAELARALQAAQAGRSARKEGGGVRVQLDPAELI